MDALRDCYRTEAATRCEPCGALASARSLLLVLHRERHDRKGGVAEAREAAGASHAPVAEQAASATEAEVDVRLETALPRTMTSGGGVDVVGLPLPSVDSAAFARGAETSRIERRRESSDFRVLRAKQKSGGPHKSTGGRQRRPSRGSATRGLLRSPVCSERAG
jgi:hypothetical protein